jgi:uncharacterized membrane protein YfcA
MLGMSKGGFPVGAIALPTLVLIWPDKAESARSAVAFMLPLLCVMDAVAMMFYRKQVQWKQLLPILPGTLAGVTIASVLFVAKESALLSVSDCWLKFCIGLVGILFVLYQATRKWILKKLEAAPPPGWTKGSFFGIAAGLTSTLAHAGGPVMRMYLLPQKLPKLQYAGTTVAFFWILNHVKLVPFAMLGRIEPANLKLAACVLPVIPVGVAAGYALVRLMKPEHYTGFIYTVLFFTSAVLVVKSLAG